MPFDDVAGRPVWLEAHHATAIANLVKVIYGTNPYSES